MQLSRFVIVSEQVRADENVLFDIVGNRQVGVNDAVLKMLRRLDADEAPEDEEEAEIAQELAALGMVVANREADDRRLREHLERAAGGMPGTMYVTLMPTLGCNLACTYCFQKDSPAFNSMTAETESAALEFILRKVDEAATPMLLVHYFGGEPLSRKSVVLRTAQVLSTSMAARGGSFAWEITTNGVNLDLPFVEAMNRFGPGIIKVTLDGDKETHDQSRVYRNGQGSFDVIFNNVVAVAGATKLRIGGNFLPDQEQSYVRLVHRLEEAGVLAKLEAIKFKPVIDTQSSTSSTCTTCSSTAKGESEALVRLDRLVRSRRVDSVQNGTLDHLVQGPCELHWDNSYVIDPDGFVYKCPAVAGRPEVAVGSVRSESLGGAPLLELRPWEQCGDCSYLPVCVGGCLGGQYLKTGRRDQVHCKKEWFAASYAESVPRRYLEELGAVPWDGEDGESADGPLASPIHAT